MAVNLFNSPSDAVMHWVERAKKFRLLMELNHAADCKKLRRLSRLSLDWDGEDSYTSKVDYVVHIGIRGSVERNLRWIESDEDLLAVLEFVRHHEVLHLYFTGGDSYAWSVQKGAEEVMKYIAAQMNNGKPVLFRKQADVERFRRQLQAEFNGVDIVALIEQISANISNCLEDGRIERIGSSDPGKSQNNPPFRGEQFATERTLNRGRNFYEYANEEFVPWEELKDDPANHLRVIINQILMLSKAQLYQKGFVSAYGDTPLMKEMAQINEHIRTGYMGVNTRKMAEGNFAICRELAPLIYESAKESAKNINAARDLMQLLQQLIEQLGGSGKSIYISMATSDSDAQDDTEGSENSALPSTDLMQSSGAGMEGDGEESNSGQPGMGNSGESGESGDSGKSGNSGKSGSDENSDEKTDQNGSGSGGGSESDENADEGDKSGEGSGNDSGDSNDEGEGQSGSNSKDGSENESKEGNGQDGSGNSSDEGQSDPNNGEGANQSGANQSGSNGPAQQKSGSVAHGKNDVDAIEQAMKQAAEQLNAINGDMVDSVNKAAKAEAEQTRADAKRVSKKIQKVDPKDMKDICPNFVELRRMYKVNEQLPAVKLQDGRTFRRWFEKFLKSKKSPAVRYRRSGKLDRGAIANLAKKDTRVFMKDSKNAMRKCCVYILIDNSGSMSGDKRMLACESAGVIEEGIKYTVPTKIVAFDWFGDVTHEVVKDWDEVYTDNCCWSFALHGREGCSNDDGYDILIATREILARPEERKILIVLSDGAPGNCRLVRDAVDKARASGIKVCGIYFEEGDVVSYSKPFIDMYQKDYVCCTADRIQENLTKIVETFLKG